MTGSIQLSLRIPKLRSVMDFTPGSGFEVSKPKLTVGQVDPIDLGIAVIFAGIENGRCIRLMVDIDLAKRHRTMEARRAIG